MAVWEGAIEIVVFIIRRSFLGGLCNFCHIRHKTVPRHAGFRRVDAARKWGVRAGGQTSSADPCLGDLFRSKRDQFDDDDDDGAGAGAGIVIPRHRPRAMIGRVCGTP